MKSLFSSLPAFTLLIIIACHDKEEVFSIEPHIEFQEIKFKKGHSLYSQLPPDTLRLTFNFTDGDSDFGLSDFDNGFPYQERSYFRRSDGKAIPAEQLNNKIVNRKDLINYGDRSFPPYDTLPGYDFPYSCLNWEVIHEEIRNSVSTIADTLYFQNNPNYYNLDVDFLVQQSDGSFLELDLTKEFCVTFNTRCPAGGSVGPVSVKMVSSKRGVTTYDMVSSGFEYVFSTRPMKLRFYVKDRAFHQSNTVETPVFTLSGI